jgi:hypothetical protein
MVCFNSFPFLENPNFIPSIPTNKMSLFLNLFISITFYMFPEEPPPIIRSSDCTYSFWYLSNLAATCCDHGWDGRFDKYQKLYVQSELPMMGGASTRNMYSIIEINKLRKVTSCWWYTRYISEDARTYECQT